MAAGKRTSTQDFVLVPRSELQQLRDDLHELDKVLGSIANQRFEVRRLTVRLEGYLAQPSDTEKTPIRPPSQDDLKAAFALRKPDD